MGNVGIINILAPMIGNLEKIDEESLYKALMYFYEKYHKTPYIDIDDNLAGQIIVAYRNKAYSISSNLTIVEIIDYDAIGSGTEPALAVLKVSEHFDLKPSTKVYLAVKTAGEIINSVSENVYMTDTKEMCFLKKKL